MDPRIRFALLVLFAITVTTLINHPYYFMILTIIAVPLGHYLSTSNILERLRFQIEIMYRIIEKLIYLLRTMNGDPLIKKIAVPDISLNNRSGKIVYMYQNNNYEVLIPYHAHLMVPMLDLQAFLLFEDGTRQEITQQPGIPYMITAHEYGAKEIEIINHDTKASKKYTANERPMFASELFD